MTAIRKVLTKAEALSEAYYLSHILEHDPDHSAHADICGSSHTEDWSGNWRWTHYWISGPDFEVSASRWKHRDGRIRNASNEVENSLAFALFCVEHFPRRDRSLLWAERLLDERLVRGSMDRRVRDWFVMPTQASIPGVKDAYAQAIFLSKVTA